MRRNEIDMENGLYRYRVLSVFGSKYALTDDEVVQPADDMGAQVTPWLKLCRLRKALGAGLHVRDHAGTCTMKVCRNCMVCRLRIGMLCLMRHRKES